MHAAHKTHAEKISVLRASKDTQTSAQNVKETLESLSSYSDAGKSRPYKSSIGDTLLKIIVALKFIE